MRRASRGGRHGGSWAGFAGFGGGKGTSRSPEAGCSSGREAERGRQPVGAAQFGQPFRRAVDRDFAPGARGKFRQQRERSEEHTSELQSLMRISYAVFCLKKKTNNSTQSEQQ